MAEFVRASLATMTGLSHFPAEHMLTPFSRVSSESNLEGKRGKEVDFQAIRIGTELPEMTFEPNSHADRNLIRQASFRFLNSLFRLAVDRLDR